VTKGRVRIKRAYEPASRDDGYRVLVDRLWPRGIAKTDLKFDTWNKELAPSPALRKWFGHKVEHWDRFREAYENELRQPDQQARMTELIKAAEGRTLTLVYAAKDEEHNHAQVLAAEIMRLY
jgi:uncharacterized protein YeaO (DUF488 family)